MKPEKNAAKISGSHRQSNGGDAGLSFEAELKKLYNKYSDLKVVELEGKHRLKSRRSVLTHVPKGGVGAEIGVFTGLFSEVLVEIIQPKKLFLVDPWAQMHGELYPNWGAYTAHRRLPTLAAKEVVKLRAHYMNTECTIVESLSIDWLNTFKRPFLDWVYLDASHKYDAVMADLHKISSRMLPGGLILGDDCWPESDKLSRGVATALHDFIETTDYEFQHLDEHGQWAISLCNI